MFYDSVKADWAAGKVRVVLPASGHGNHVRIEADGLAGLKAAFLSGPERQRLADLAKADARSFAHGNLPLSGKGKSILPPELIDAEMMLKEYRHALVDGLGTEGHDYELICVSWLVGLSNIGLAYRLENSSAYLLVNGTCGTIPDYLPPFLLDASKEMTEFLRAFVVPDQQSEDQVTWYDQKRMPITAFRFKLADSPARLTN